MCYVGSGKVCRFPSPFALHRPWIRGCCNQRKDNDQRGLRRVVEIECGDRDRSVGVRKFRRGFKIAKSGSVGPL
jgi:hypothetical protein